MQSLPSWGCLSLDQHAPRMVRATEEARAGVTRAEDITAVEGIMAVEAITVVGGIITMVAIIIMEG